MPVRSIRREWGLYTPHRVLHTHPENDRNRQREKVPGGGADGQGAVVVWFCGAGQGDCD